MGRIMIFLTVNLLVVVTISLSLNLLGVRPYLDAYRIDFSSLLVFCGFVGFSGALISLVLSRWTAKRMMGVRTINPDQPKTGVERELLDTVDRLAQKAKLPAMPEVGIYPSKEVNAFATGPSRSKSLIAVSSGFLERMDGKAVEGVLGHEIAHIANGDMVTMTLIQGVVNTFVMFFARICAWIISKAVSNARDGKDARDDFNPMVHWIAVLGFEIVFSLLSTIVVAYFSRIREFRADRQGAELIGVKTMVHALKELKQNLRLVDPSHQSVASLKISGGRFFFSLFATHPDLDLRIEKLGRWAGISGT